MYAVKTKYGHVYVNVHIPEKRICGFGHATTLEDPMISLLHPDQRFDFHPDDAKSIIKAIQKAVRQYEIGDCNGL